MSNKLTLTHPDNPTVSFVIELNSTGEISTKKITTKITTQTEVVNFMSFEN